MISSNGGTFAKKLSTAIFALFCVALAACGSDGVFNPYTPVFTAPVAKIADTGSPSFTERLYYEALAYEPILAQPGAQIHMGYWSGAGNHGSLVRLLDAINSTPSTDSPPQRAIWDEGATSSNQYPDYVLMLTEHWYDRSAALGGIVTIYGVQYGDPYPVTFQQADDIWGQYSQRYAETAYAFQSATGNAVKTWCYVIGARANRIFYVYELPKLRELEAAGAVQVFFAKTQDANWQNPDDWTEGTANAPVPAAADESLEERLRAAAAEGKAASSPRGISLDDF